MLSPVTLSLFIAVGGLGGAQFNVFANACVNIRIHYTHANLFQFIILSVDEVEAKFGQLKMGVGKSMGGPLPCVFSKMSQLMCFIHKVNHQNPKVTKSTWTGGVFAKGLRGSDAGHSA